MMLGIPITLQQSAAQPGAETFLADIKPSNVVSSFGGKSIDWDGRMPGGVACVIEQVPDRQAGCDAPQCPLANPIAAPIAIKGCHRATRRTHIAITTGAPAAKPVQRDRLGNEPCKDAKPRRFVGGSNNFGNEESFGHTR